MTASVSGPPVPRLSLIQRLVGVIVSPGATFRSVAAHPTWLGVLVVQLVVTGAAFAAFLSTDVGKAAYVDQSVSSIESFGGTVSDRMYEGLRRQAEFAWMIQPATMLIFGPVIVAVLAAVLFGVFTLMGGESTYRHVFAVVVHAGVVTMLQPLLTLPLNYQLQSMTSATSLAAFLPMLDEGSFFASLLGVMDLFYLWYAIVLAMGLAAVYRRRVAPITAGLLVVLVVIGVAVATLKVALGGKMKASTKKWVIGAVIVATACAVVVANMRYRRQTGKQVTAEVLQARDLTAIVSASGKIRAKRTVNISADNMGRVTRLAVDEGQRVSRGEFLLQIDPQLLSSAVQQGQAGLAAARSQLEQQRMAVVAARENLGLARTNLRREQELWAQQLTTRQSLDQAENVVKISEAELSQREQEVKTQDQRIHQEEAAVAQARFNLSRVRIESPIDGIVTRRNIEEGETVVIGTMNNPGTVLLTIADMSVVDAEVEVDETDIPSVRIGQTATIMIDALPGRELTGTVTEIGNSPIQTSTGQPVAAGQSATNFMVKVTLDEALEELRPGFTCTAQITTSTRQKAVAVPIQAMAVRDVVYDRSGAIVRSPREEGKARSATPTVPADLPEGHTRRETEGVFVIEGTRAVFTPVKTGIAGDRYFEVLDGLQVGARVITGPFNSVRDLQDGDEVRTDEPARKQS